MTIRLRGRAGRALAPLSLLLFAPLAQASYPLSVGCPWIEQAININTKNLGYPDAYANYSESTLPNAGAGDGVTMTVHGRYPKAAYFSFQLASGFSFGNLYDQIPDAALVSDSGRPANSNVAQLPYGLLDGGDDTYTLTVKFEDVPGNGPREQNVLYAGAQKQGVQSRQIIMRVYMPDPGVDVFGGVPLPTVTYHGPLGTIDVNNTPDAGACKTREKIWDAYNILFVPAVPSPRPRFAPVSVLGNPAGLYPNGDSVYLRAQPSLSYAPMVVVRAKAPTYPPLLPATLDNPDVRYWSLCQNQLFNTAAVGCIADRDMKLDSAGYFTAVISPAAKRPATATAAAGYNWLDWGPSNNAFIAIRQILSRPDFDGNYRKALNAPTTPIQQTLGDWAPDISYCDAATFDGASAQGGAAVMQACHARYN